MTGTFITESSGRRGSSSSRHRCARAHLASKKWSSSAQTVAPVSLLLLAFVASTHAPLAVQCGAVSAASSVTSGAGGSMAAAAASAISSGGSNNRAVASAHQQQWEKRQREIDSLLAQLQLIESRATSSLAECSTWYKLNVRYEQLVGGQRRPEAVEKERECDQLERVLAQQRERLERFKRLLRVAGPHLAPVNELVNQYLELSAPESEQLARELHGSDASAYSELKQFIEIMRDTLAAGNQLPAAAAAAAAPVVVSASPATVAGDEPAMLDAALRQLVDREALLTPDELNEMTELCNQLEQVLASGRVPITSGRFRYLSGTLDAARAVMLQGLLEEQEQENQRLQQEQQELLLRKQQAEAELAKRNQMLESRMARNRVHSPRMVSRAPNPLVGRMVTNTSVAPASSATTTSSAGAMAGAMAATSGATASAASQAATRMRPYSMPSGAHAATASAMATSMSM